MSMFCEELDTSSERSLLYDRFLVEGGGIVYRRRCTGIANLRSLCKRAWHSFSDGPSSASNVPCHTPRGGLTHSPHTPVVSEATNYLLRVDIRVTKRGDSSDVFSHRDGSTGVSRGSFDHRAYQSMDEV